MLAVAPLLLTLVHAAPPLPMHDLLVRAAQGEGDYAAPGG